ncbi:11958_t:CDS:2, partial [Entrophospora sp. SA101]
AHDLDSFKEAFQKSKRYPYTMSDLEYLSEKTILFLLNYFQQIYKNLGLLGDEVELNINNQERMSIEFHNALNNIKEW